MFKSSSEIERNYTIEDLEELLDNIPYEIYIKSINGRYKYVNKTAIDKAGLKKEEIINKNDFEIRSYNKAKICVESDREVINIGNKTFIESKTYVDNVETSYEIFKTLLFNNKKEKVMIGGISKFIIEDKGLCNEIIKNFKYKDTENLKQAMELESLKSEFFANISHEFKTPLNIILSTVQLIMSYIDINNDYPSIETFNKYIKSIRQNSYRLLKLANNMIDTTKIEDGFYQININNYNIVEIVENIVQSLALYIKNSKRNIVFDTIEEEIILACDPDQIERVILNLLSNAMKFTCDDGNIYVSMESDEPFNKILIRIGNDGQPLDIKDSKKIFKRFTQSESLLTRRIEGSGIGLSISKAIIEMHKGDIYVNTKIKKGTEFCIELPIRKIMNYKEVNIREKSRIAKIEKFHIEFSDIYDLDNKIIEKNNNNI